MLILFLLKLIFIDVANASTIISDISKDIEEDNISL